jgi:tetratricopeptide (TPR) repeat protein
MRLRLLLFLLLFFGHKVSTAQEFQQRQALWDSTLLWIGAKEYSLARNGLERLHLEFPTSTKVLYNLGVVYAREHLDQQAYDVFSKLAALDPKFPNLQRTLGLLAIRTGQKGRVAVDHFKRAIEEDSTRFDAWMNLGSLSLGLNDHRAAAEYLKKAQQLTQNEWTPSLELSRTYRRIRDLDSASDIWQRIPQSGINQADFSSELALVLIEFNQWDSAMTMLRKAFNHAMDDPIHRMNFAVMLMETKRFEEAEKVLISLEDQKDLYIPLALNFAALNLKRGKIDEAIDRLNALVKELPELGVAWMNLGIAYEHKLMKREACHCWQKSANLGTPNAQNFLANECVEF